MTTKRRNRTSKPPRRSATGDAGSPRSPSRGPATDTSVLPAPSALLDTALGFRSRPSPGDQFPRPPGASAPECNLASIPGGRGTTKGERAGSRTDTATARGSAHSAGPSGARFFVAEFVAVEILISVAEHRVEETAVVDHRARRADVLVDRPIGGHCRHHPPHMGMRGL